MGQHLSAPAFDRNYERLEPLGKGSFGAVCKVRNRNTKQCYALKKMTLPLDVTQRVKFDREAELLRIIYHPNIVSCYGSVIDWDTSLGIILELCELKDLNHFVMRTTNVSVDLRVLLMYDMCNGLNFLHQNNIVHRDMKPANVLVTWSQMYRRPYCKISDFGEAKVLAFLDQLSDKASNLLPNYMYLASIHGTKPYMAPEVLRNHYTSSCDEFSLGVIFYALFSKDLTWVPNILCPYVDGQCMYQVPFAQITNAVERLQTLPTPLRKLTLNMLKTDYHQRITIREVKETLMTYIMCRQQELRSQALLTQGTLPTGTMPTGSMPTGTFPTGPFLSTPMFYTGRPLPAM